MGDRAGRQAARAAAAAPPAREDDANPNVNAMAQAFAQALAQAGVGQPPPNQALPPQAAVFAKTPHGVQAQMGAFVDYTQTSGRKPVSYTHLTLPTTSRV